jgi:hypothetical protein
MKHILKIIIPALMLGLMSQLGWAEIPNMINYQGYLTDSDGSPIDGTVNLTFSLYGTDSGGSPLWSDSYLVLVVNGLVNKDLGPINLDLIHPVYLGIQIESDPEMSPRQALTSVPFAYVAEKAADTDKLGGIDSSNFLTSETDPTVPANLKDGVNWSEVSNRPTGLDDGDDVGITLETDPEVGSNTTDYVPKWNGSALVTSTIYDNGNVGIGTATPNSKLEVAGTIHSTSGGVKFPDGTTQTTAASGGGSGDGHSLDAADGDPTDAVYVDNSGNVGIGTTTPARKLHISDVMQLEPRTNAPANPSNGDFYFDSTGAFCGYSNGEWFRLGGNGNCNFEIPEFAGGSGTPEDPYQIAFCQQLQNMKDHSSSHFVLNNDINCSDTVNWNSGAGFEPIGYFSGTLDGKFHQISNLFINGSFSYMGLISQTSGATISNVRVFNADMTNSSSSLSRDGILVGYLNNNSSVIYCSSSGTIRGYRVGGLIGLSDKSYILSSKSSAEVFSTTGSRAGGLVGVLGCHNFGLIKNSYATGTVHGSSSTYTAGLVAQAGCIFSNSSAHVENSYYVGSISKGGGLVGQLDTGDAVSYGRIVNSFAASEQPEGSSFIRSSDSRTSGSNNYWLNTENNPANPGSLSESPIAKTSASYFYDGSNEPMISWDSSQWTFSGSDYPKLKWESGACDGGGCPVPPANIPPSIGKIIQPDGINDIANANYTIQWTDSDPDDNAAVSLYYDTDNSGEDGTLIVSNISEDGTTYASYNWNTTAIPEGNYYIYAVIDDGINAPVVTYSGGVMEKNNSISIEDIAIFANYNGGTFTVDVDQPIKKIGFLAYEVMNITITGAYASDIDEIEVSGYNIHSVSGVDPSKISQRATQSPLDPATLVDPDGNSNMVCAYGKGTTGGCNTYPQAKDYFETKLGGMVRFEKLQSGAFTGTISISTLDSLY